MIQDRDGDDQHTSSVVDASQDIDSDLTVGRSNQKNMFVLLFGSSLLIDLFYLFYLLSYHVTSS